MRVLITGAAGNLGAMLARYLLKHSDHFLNLMIHKRELPEDLAQDARLKVYRCNLAEPQTLVDACMNTDAIVHFAGVLFAPNPEGFLPVTNFQYMRNLVDVAIQAKVKRFILISFPHVEGPTSASDPCTERQDRQPISVHAKTRLEAEKYLIRKGREHGMRAISLRPGMIYGKDVLMISFARRLAMKGLLAVWNRPTPIHLISIDDFLACCQAAMEKDETEGIYSLGDDEPTTLQDFLDAYCCRWELQRPWRVPLWSVYAVAWLCEMFAKIFKTQSPFTVDFTRIGLVPYYCDTGKMKKHLLAKLKYPSWKEGIKSV
ncbi:NAD(P)-dependent oxidoreductase [Candidatus Peregrinibacteria bacterium]|nr:NAD(P)-dependent oxidoreductase [Candidatus Peregrinibacteria bacterium]